MTIELPPLPYEQNALEPHISAQTVKIHFGKHHQGYVNKVNAALKESGSDAGLDELVRTAEGSLFNNAAQVWNHTFYWRSLSPNGGGEPRGGLKEALESAFGSVQAAKAKLADAASNEFGSGWAWLVLTDSGLEIISTTDAQNPIRDGNAPLLTIDVWEHAYYLDRQNRRGDYIDAVINNLLNWTFAETNFDKAMKVKKSN